MAAMEKSLEQLRKEAQSTKVEVSSGHKGAHGCAADRQVKDAYRNSLAEKGSDGSEESCEEMQTLRKSHDSLLFLFVRLHGSQEEILKLKQQLKMSLGARSK